MNRSPRSAGFTLIEMITVIAIIVILVSLVLSVNGLVQRKAAMNRTLNEIQALSGACEAYKTDNGGYPQDVTPNNSVTNSLDPRTSLSPSSYYAACNYLYMALSGQTTANGATTQTGTNYAPDFFKSARLAGGPNTSVPTYMMDPYGNCYGYSTAGLELQQEYQAQLAITPSATMPATNSYNTVGYNSTFDLWSTGGMTSGLSTDVPKWVKNW